MAGSVNKVILIGNLGKDPEIRTLENGTKLARFSLATSESYSDRATGERKEITDWHNVVVWRGLAEVVEKYVRKGMKVYIEGKLKTRSWQDEAGATKYATEVVADNMTMLTSRNEQMQNGEAGANTPYPQEGTTSKPDTNLSDQIMSDDEEDDLPF
jgi:single-strand DNA-binding protein